jgi:lactate permease
VSIPLNPFLWIMAAVPISVLLILMVVFQWGAKKAAPIGLILAVIIAVFFFKAPMNLLFSEGLKGVWSALIVLMIVWPAILLFEVVQHAQAFTVIRTGIQKYSPNELIQVLALGWVFTSFLQGITGFGVPVAVGAPLLIGIGVNPISAVVIPLIGNAWAGTFGTLAVAWDALVIQTGLSSDPVLMAQTAFYATVFIWCWNLIIGIAISWIYGGIEAIRKGWYAIFIISLIQGGGQLLMVRFSTTLAAFIPSTLALISIFWLSKTKRYNTPWTSKRRQIMMIDTKSSEIKTTLQDRTMVQAFFPYLFLSVMTLIILMFSPIKSIMSTLKFGYAFPMTSTGYGYINPAISMYSPISPLTSAGFFLLSSALIGYIYFRHKKWLTSSDGKSLLNKSLKKTIPSAIAVTCFIMMSKIMSGSGQIVILAQGIAALLGNIYGLIAPLIGMMGAFMTSSNMASNILFGEFQLTSARLLGLNAAAILGAQTAGGAIGTAIAPGNIILGTTTAGILGQEGLILKKLLPITLFASLLIGIILLFVLI